MKIIIYTKKSIIIFINIINYLRKYSFLRKHSSLSERGMRRQVYFDGIWNHEAHEGHEKMQKKGFYNQAFMLEFFGQKGAVQLYGKQSGVLVHDVHIVHSVHQKIYGRYRLYGRNGQV